jgi:hypothetical protein
MIRRLVPTQLLLSSALASFAQTMPPGVRKMASMGGIAEYDYPNGLKVLLFPDAAQPKITVNVTYLVSSRHEGYGETGMAHGANWNGTMSDDRTNYYETFNVEVTSVLINSKGQTPTVTDLPVTIGNLAPKTTVRSTYVFPGSVGVPGTSVIGIYDGTYTGGSFSRAL